MPAKTFSPRSGILALFVLIPLYRPILVAHHLIYPVYAIFLLAFLVVLPNIGVLKYAHRKQLVLLLSYTFTSVIATLFVAQDIRLDYLGLLCFLSISYIFGIWLGKNGNTHFFFWAAALIFVPIAVYVVFQLSKSSFSYNTYYYWSSATYKIDYLTTSLYAMVLLIYFFFNGRNSIEKYAITSFCFVFIAMSGARYSIIFAMIAGVYMSLRTAKKSPTKLIIGLFASLLLLVYLVLFDESFVSKSTNLVNYSLFRLENLFGNDNSVEGRIVLMNKASEVISKHFFFGVGVAGSSEALASNYPHNMLLEAFIDGGFFAVFPLLMFLVYSLYLLITSKHEQKAWCLLLVLFLLGAFLKSFSIYESRILFFFIGYAATLSFYLSPTQTTRV